MLTNYRELQNYSGAVKGQRSRGGMVTTWLGEPANEGVKQSARRLVEEGEGVKGVGGFSLVCGKLKRKSEGFAVVSNRAGAVDEVPIVSPDQIQGWGLTNATFDSEEDWPKLSGGIAPFDTIVREHGQRGEAATESELIDKLFGHLDTNKMHGCEHMDLYEAWDVRKESIFVPLHGNEQQHAEMKEARAKGKGHWPTEEELENDHPPQEDVPAGTGDHGFISGLYGTQRQTVILVDRKGHVTFVERALFDANGNDIPRGEGDVSFEFQIDGWDS